MTAMVEDFVTAPAAFSRAIAFAIGAAGLFAIDPHFFANEERGRGGHLRFAL